MRNSLQVMEVTIGDGVAVIRREHQSAPTVAKVLGRERNGTTETVYLDRLVHELGQDWQEWSASGAISTILSRTLPEGASDAVS